jgi:hypothetical protein
MKEGEIIYMLPEASRPKAGQIGLAFPWQYPAENIEAALQVVFGKETTHTQLL